MSEPEATSCQQGKLLIKVFPSGEIQACKIGQDNEVPENPNWQCLASVADPDEASAIETAVSERRVAAKKAITAKNVDANKDGNVDWKERNAAPRSRSRSRSAANTAGSQEPGGSVCCQIDVCSSQPLHVEPVDHQAACQSTPSVGMRVKRKHKKKPKKKRSKKIKPTVTFKMARKKMKKRLKRTVKKFKNVMKVKEVKKKIKKMPAVVAKHGKKKTRKPRKTKSATRRERLPAAASERCAGPSTMMLHSKTPIRQCVKKLTMAARSKKKKTRKPASTFKPRKKKQTTRRKRLPAAASERCAGPSAMMLHGKTPIRQCVKNLNLAARSKWTIEYEEERCSRRPKRK